MPTSSVLILYLNNKSGAKSSFKVKMLNLIYSNMTLKKIEEKFYSIFC